MSIAALIPRNNMKRVITHLSVAGIFLGLAVLWSFPLILHLGSRIPGTGAGDNITFLWNLFWARHAWTTEPTMHTQLIFFPVGVDLTLHTHTLLNGLLASTVFTRVPFIVCQNLLILIWLTLNGYTATLLARDILRSWSGALLAGVVFGGSPYLMVHLLGHFNLISPWGIALFLFFYRRALRESSRKWSFAAGFLFGLLPYLDYYYFVYAGLAAVVLLVVRWCEISLVRSEMPSRMFNLLVLCAASLAGLGILIVLVSGGTAFEIAGRTISMRSSFNLRTALGLLGVGWLIRNWKIRIRMIRERVGVVIDIRTLATIVLTGTVVMLPIIVFGVRLWLAGDYIGPDYVWKSATRGIDFVAPLAGNPLHPIFGAGSRHLFERMETDFIEGVAWLGIVPGILLVTGWRRRRDQWMEAREWWALLAFFAVWALGPYVYVLGTNSGVLLPQMMFRHVPLLSNARIPGRAIVMVYLAMGIVAALRLQTWGSGARRHVVHMGLALLVAADYLAAPLPLYELDRPAIYQHLVRDPFPGALCELPFGIRDGFGEIGRLDHRVLYYQTIHRRPIVGGFVARLSPRVRERYSELPVIGSLLRLSDGQAIAAKERALNPAEASRQLAMLGVRFIMVNRTTASADLLEYVERTLPLILIAREGERELYRLQSSN